MCKRLIESMRYVGLTAVMLVFSGGSMAGHLTDEQCDINDDGVVSVLDLYAIIGLLGTASGTENYREGLELVPDGIIDLSDYLELIGSGCFGIAGIDTSPTSVSGKVFDGIGNPLEDVTVQIGTNTVIGMTNAMGAYNLVIPPQDLGNTVITFDGSTATDPTPDVLSGQYPTIPNKPIFINGGTEMVFRDMSLPERDLAGAVNLDDTNSMADPNDTNTRILIQETVYNNAGVNMAIPAGCAVTFPEGEAPVLSITRVDPSMLPVPMPPGLASSIFVTYQPGGTVVDCPNGGAPQIETLFDNVDGFVNSMVPVDSDDPDQPFLAGIDNGVFKKLAIITVLNADGTVAPVGVVGPLLQADVATPFEFAWYHVDVPLLPCPRTTVIGQVKLFGTTTPVAGAAVSVPGAAVVFTDDNGNFSISNVPAGPNGLFCNSNPFSIRASATNNSSVGVSPFTPMNPGGSTEVECIFIGTPGTVQGRVTKLFSIDDPITPQSEPFTVVPLEGASVNVSAGSFSGSDDTDTSGNYMVGGVPIGFYDAQAIFDPKNFFASVIDQIVFQGDIDAVNFRFVSTGAVKVTVRDSDGNLAPDSLVSVETEGSPLPGGFKQPSILLFPQLTGPDGMVTFGDGLFENGVPLGPCTVALLNPFDPLGPPIAVEDCFVNEHGETVEVTLVFDISLPAFLTHAFELNGSTRDTFGGPDMVLPNPLVLGLTGLTFDPGEGPNVSGVVDPNTYSLEMFFELVDIQGFKKLVDFKDRESDIGLYNLQSSVNFFTLATGPAGAIAANTPIHLVATRNGLTNEFTTYVNGVPQINFIDSEGLARFDGPDNIAHLLRNDQFFAEDPEGFLDYVRFYAGVLTPEEVADLADEAVPSAFRLFGTDASGGVVHEIGEDGSGMPFATLGGPTPSLAINREGTYLYAGGGGGNPMLTVIDVATGDIVSTHDTGLGFASIGGLGFDDDGTLWGTVNVVGAGGTGADHLATFDLETGQATLIGSFGICVDSLGNPVVVQLPATGAEDVFCDVEGVEGLAFGDGVIWGSTTARGGGPVGIWEIDGSTGRGISFTPLMERGGSGPPSGGVSALEFWNDGDNGWLLGGTAREIGGAGDGGRIMFIDALTGLFDYLPNPTTDGSSLGGIAIRPIVQQF